MASIPLPPVVIEQERLQLHAIPRNTRLKPAARERVSEIARYLSDADECPPLEAPTLIQFNGKTHTADSKGSEAVNALAGATAPLDWWRLHGTRLPFLSSLARKYLCIPATSAEPERVWSAAKLLCSDLRAGQLDAETIEAHLFLHRNSALLPAIHPPAPAAAAAAPAAAAAAAAAADDDDL